MIHYYEPADSWVSGKNPDEQGMPTTNLTGDTEVCLCRDCATAASFGFGYNFQDLPEE
jgi:hypothetical protein